MHLQMGVLLCTKEIKRTAQIAEASAIKTNLGFYKAVSLLELPYHLVKQTTLLRFGMIPLPHPHPESQSGQYAILES